MNHETLQALYQLDVDEVGEEEAATRWEYAEEEINSWCRLPTNFQWYGDVQYRRKPGIPWPLVMQQTQEELLTLDRIVCGSSFSLGGKRIPPEDVYLQPTITKWPDDAPEWADRLTRIFYSTVTFRSESQPYVFKPKPKDYCGVCGEWLGGPVECCGESHLKPPVTKDEAVAVRAARKPVKQKCKCCGQEVE